MDTDFTNDDDVRVILIVHDTKPPFLDGRTVFTKQARRAPRPGRPRPAGCMPVSAARPGVPACMLVSAQGQRGACSPPHASFRSRACRVLCRPPGIGGSGV